MLREIVRRLIRLLPYLAFLSLLYGYLAVQTRSAVSSAILHVGHNAGAALAAYLGLTSGLVGLLGRYANGRAVSMAMVALLLWVNIWAVRRFAQQWIARTAVEQDA